MSFRFQRLMFSLQCLVERVQRLMILPKWVVSRAQRQVFTRQRLVSGVQLLVGSVGRTDTRLELGQFADDGTRYRKAAESFQNTAHVSRAHALRRKPSERALGILVAPFNNRVERCTRRIAVGHDANRIGAVMVLVKVLGSRSVSEDQPK